MQVAIIQSALHWEDKHSNLAMFDDWMGKINKNVDIVVLPEMFTTGFSMKPRQFAEPLHGNTAQWLLAKSEQLQAVITGSIILELSSGQYFNGMLWAFPDGKIELYCKRHLFSYGHEQLHYSKGNKQKNIQVGEWLCNAVVCYDLRFPVWLRRTQQFNYDMMVVCANWPERRAYQWKQLLIARAIENQCYVLACNRVGTDGNGIYHSGQSCIINPMGEVLQELVHHEGILYQQLVKSEVEDWRSQFKALDDADEFEIKT